MSPERRTTAEDLDKFFETDPSRFLDPEYLATIRHFASSLICFAVREKRWVFLHNVINWIADHKQTVGKTTESFIFQEEVGLIRKHGIEFPYPWTSNMTQTLPPPRKYESLNAIDLQITPWFAERGYTIGFATGVFDLLHAGHILFLRQCKSRCHFLIVGVDSNELVTQQKGSPRPLNDFTNRVATLCGLPEVDLCYRVEAYFDGRTPFAFLPTTLHTRYNPNPQPDFIRPLDWDFVRNIAPHVKYFVTEGDPTLQFKAQESATWGVNMVVFPKLTGLSSTAIANHFGVKQSTYMPNRFSISPWWLQYPNVFPV